MCKPSEIGGPPQNGGFASRDNFYGSSGMCTKLKFLTWFNVALKVVGQVVHSLLDEKASEKNVNVAEKYCFSRDHTMGPKTFNY